MRNGRPSMVGLRPSPGPLLVLAPLLALAASCRGGSPTPPSIILVTIDTLRADHLGCYGAAGVETPVLDAIAREGTLYEQAMSAAPITLVSHATILTGLTPPAHGVRTNGTFRLPAAVDTLAERLGARGFATGAFVGSFVLHHEFGLDQGFETYDDALPARSGRRFDFEERRASEVLERAGRWAISKRGAKFFLWAHLFDPHVPYDPPPPFDRRFSDRPYDGEIAYVDKELGTFLEGLSRAGILDRALLVVTSDHGEGLGEHGEKTHALFLYESTLRVPLIVRSPGGGGGPVRVKTPVGLVDIAPSILSFVDRAAESARGAVLAGPPMEGRVLPSFPMGTDRGAEAGLAAGNPADPGAGAGSGPRRAGDQDAGYYFENLLPHYSYGWAGLRGFRAGSRKVIRSVRSELYDLDADPGEMEDRSDRDTAGLEEMTARLERAARIAEERGAKGAENPDMSSQARERLLALGYVAAGGQRAASFDSGPDPRDMLPFFEGIESAKDAIRERRSDEAVRRLEALASKPPSSVAVLGLLGQVRMERGEVDAAMAVLRRARDLDPKDYEIRRRLAEALYAAGAFGPALAEAREALRLNDQNAESRSILGAALARLGRHEEAIASFREAIAQRPQEARLHYNLGLALEDASRRAEAEKAYEQSVSLDPAASTARAALARLLVARGDLAGARRHLEEALRIDPDDAAILEPLGILLARMGDAKGALARFEQLVALDPDRAEAHYDRGLVLEQLERRGEAAAAFRAFLSRWKGDPARAEAAREHLRRLGS